MKIFRATIISIFFSILIHGTIIAREHIVVAGDTLYSISKQYQVSIEDIQRLNQLNDSTKLSIGMLLIIPDDASIKFHVVAKGDTYYSIARLHQITVDELLQINKITKDHILQIGEQLIVHSSTQENQTQDTPPTPPPPQKRTPPPIWPDAGSINNATPILPDPDVIEELPVSHAPIAPAKSNNKEPQSTFWPISGKVEPYTGRQGGVTISAIKDTTVLSIATGTVIYLGPYRELGNIVLIEKSGGYVYIYGGLDAVFVTSGQEITAGIALGLINTGGKLVFSVFKDANPIDPTTAPRN
ncbi:M23 family metallopeptidase [Entomospira nematocerorum]|uniref:M23 family metallopeptidase n=1 Tax=Entomospira nematocerorum TaxID=2719987 RepID=A0A968GB92_9SPIO|nr:M23 family metallopeptidase [Entomospira nematocera]NIZ46672.1 M23 family metallopeptidase [Entomospira nematocera]WDI33531.1 M23 family metallopeptidase [Entomospira nematocera]